MNFDSSVVLIVLQLIFLEGILSISISAMLLIGIANKAKKKA